MVDRSTATPLALAVQSFVDVDQFYGIEIGEFPVRIAATALWMMDHIMNNRLSLEFGQTYARIPIEKSPHIRNADALEIDWTDLLPPDECSYVFGNPPFGGAKYQSPEQREQVRRVAALEGRAGTLDYVTAWFILAGDYVRRAQKENGARPPRIGFVATNSITQGEQVAQLWPLLLDHRKLEIAFAHRTFAWGSDARGKAHVHVVIVGLDTADRTLRDRRLFAYDDINGEPLEGHHAVITPYLLDGGALADPHVVVREEGRPINSLPRLIIGSKPIDGGHYVLDAAGRAELLAACPEVAPFVRPYVGSWEYLNGGERYILCLHDAPPELLRREPALRQRVAAVREFRQRSTSAPTRTLATTPTLFHTRQRDSQRPVPGRAGGQLRAPRVRPDRLARTASRPEQSRTRPGRRDQTDLRLAHVGDAHGVAAPHRRAAEERLPLLHRPRLQHVSAAARIRGGGHVGATRPARAGRARRSCCPCRRNAGRHVRPGPDAAGSSQGASGAGSSCRSSVPTEALRVGA